MTAATASPGRDRTVDALRAGSLVVVVLWHWVFSVIEWRPDGPHASNPIGTTAGLWALTWFAQPMALFFMIGGFANGAAWRSVRARGGGVSAYLRKRLLRLVLPAAVTVAAGLCALLAVRALVPDVEWATRGIVLVLSPLWFLGVYLVLVALTPLAWWAHERGGEVVLVLLTGLAIWGDIARFRFEIGAAPWFNMVIIWALVHQAGFVLDRLRAAPRRSQLSLALAGFIGLTGLTNMGLYPRSMVGVPGETISNMGPPTLAIIALSAFQVGLITLLWQHITAALQRPRVSRAAEWLQTNSMTLFLWHLPGYALGYGLLWAAGWDVPQEINGRWWLERPLWVLVPAVCTWPLLRLFRLVERAGAGRS